MDSRNNKFENNSAQASESALIVHPILSDDTFLNRDIKSQLIEIKGLVRSINLQLVQTITVKVSRIQAGYFIGKGGRDTIREAINCHSPNVVIFNYNLSPVQQRNLEMDWNVKVIDRTGLILEIFGYRARTKEGKIQVELAALQYQRSRLVRSWTHLERQRGGAGFMGGPGETQIEIDRRIIGNRIVKLKKDIKDIKRTRDLARKSRDRIPYPIVALVGYTNAGKSTLFNNLTGADVFVEDLPFATLDPTMRSLKLGKSYEVILSDTVGFISDLPTSLIAAFKSTLEQVIYADIIIHVRDIACCDEDTQKVDVVNVLTELGLDYDQDDRIIEVLNKIDLLSPEDREKIENYAKMHKNIVALSALTGTGKQELFHTIENLLLTKRSIVRFCINSEDGKALSWLYRNSHIFDRIDETSHISIDIEISPADLGRFINKYGYEPEFLNNESKKNFMAANIDVNKVTDLLRECASEYILPRYNKLKAGDILHKTSKLDLVTIADQETEDRLIKDLSRMYPGSIVIGEESVYEGKASLEELKNTSKMIWVVDPVDGTQNFVKGKQDFAIMLACVINGKTQFGWIYDVLGDEAAIAEKGSGAYYLGKKLQVAKLKPLHECNAFVGYKYLPKILQGYTRQESKNLNKFETLNCVAHEYIKLASGSMDLGLYGRIKAWDHLAGTLLVSESGGYCAKWDKTDYKPKDNFGGLLVASNRTIWNETHDILLKRFVNEVTENPKLLL